MSTQIPELLTVKEAADLLRVTPKTLYEQRYSDRAPGNLGRKIGSRMMFRSSDLSRWLSETFDSPAVTR